MCSLNTLSIKQYFGLFERKVLQQGDSIYEMRLLSLKFKETIVMNEDLSKFNFGTIQ